MSNEKKLPSKDEIQDIVSSSVKKAVVEPIVSYGNGIYKHLDVIVKVISFLIAIVVLAVFLLAAFLLYSKDVVFTVISIGLVILGIIVSMITMFLIYSLGHIISQNDAVLRKLQEMDR